ncbi:MAG TPA: ABATE domain-containing protein [Candidatus Binataceae bacterium]|nr:ABATE domain-containing protein [Candidatus Binataceae bacterium]
MTTNHTRPPAMFIGGDPALDFLNSIGTPVDTVVEWIANGNDLMTWLGQAELVAPDAAATVRANCFPGELDAVAGQARALREWFRAFVVKHRGRALGRGALRELEPLNRILERDDAYGAIVARRSGPRGQSAKSTLEWRTLRRWRTPDSLLLPIAHAIANFITSEDLSRVKSCERSPCTLFFLDTTRGPARRWCSMTVCGNRAKQALYRARRKRQKRSASRKTKSLTPLGRSARSERQGR